MVTDIYDEVLYPGTALRQTSPDRLYVIGRLAGMNPANPSECNVLELGCGNGRSLVAMATIMPKSRFVGIDRAGRALQQGTEAAHSSGLVNVLFKQEDLLNVSPELGEFDYIIAHGVYSWVPGKVQDALLQTIHDHLAPGGVAYVSYNTMPGWHLRGMVREMMLFHIRNIRDTKERIDEAYRLLKFLDKAANQNDLYGQFIKKEVHETLQHERSYLFHDDLAETNSPVYFHEFAEHASRSGLKFMGEADFYETQFHIYPEEISQTLQAMNAEDVLLKEQYLDFLKCRRFRQTLLCHDSVKLSQSALSEPLREFHLYADARPMSYEVDLRPEIIEEFKGPRGSKASTDHTLSKAALLHLSRVHPDSIKFSELVEQSRLMLKQSGLTDTTDDRDIEILADIMLQTYSSGLIELYSEPFLFTTEPGPRPLGSPLARYEAESGRMVTNLKLKNVLLDDEIAYRIFRLLDGTRTREDLAAEPSIVEILDSTQGSTEGSGFSSRLAVVDTRLKRLASLALILKN
jgi:methyltransferase-like protein/ubiquinone/menaquinone biosynthesis C-methylase UbiE